MTASDHRRCRVCGELYSASETYETSPHYFAAPYDYGAACDEWCLACWLGVGPADVPTLAAHE